MLEYKVIHGTAIHHLEQKLNENGKEGWKLVHVWLGNDQLPVLVLEREVKDFSSSGGGNE